MRSWDQGSVGILRAMCAHSTGGWSRAASAVALLMIALAGCGGDDSGSSEKTKTKTVTTPTSKSADSTSPATSSSKASKTVTGPAECPYKAGVKLVVNTGTVTCSEAADVASRSSGPNSSTAPPGWRCDQFPVALDGKELTAADGKGCKRGNTTLSVYSASAVSGSSGSGGGESIPSGGPEVGAFMSPSGNILCAKHGKALECALGGQPPSYRLSKTGPASKTNAVHNKGLEPSPLLYGKHVTVLLGIPCKSEEAGVTCTNRSGHGFFLSKQRQRLF